VTAKHVSYGCLLVGMQITKLEVEPGPGLTCSAVEHILSLV
jgi:hypothetical protein